MNEEAVRELTSKLANRLLGSPFGVDEESYEALLALYGEVMGESMVVILDAAVDATDGYYYYPTGNEAEAVVVGSGDLTEQSMERLLEALDNWGGESVIALDDEPEVELYDDLAD